MNAPLFVAMLTESIVILCERCGEKAVTLQIWLDWKRGVFISLYQCPRCGNTDWFAHQPDEVEGSEPEKPEGMDNGYL